MKRYSVVLADDHALVRAGLRQLITTFESFTVVGEANDGLEAIAKAEALQPDIVILDIAMPRMRGLEAIQDIKRVSPSTHVLILSMHDRDEYVQHAFRKKADGYLLKSSAAEELLAALQYISRGEIYLSPAISKSIVNDWLREDSGEKEGMPEKMRLTDREQAVLKLIAEGLSNKKVAELLHISTKTIETHRSHIMEKLQLQGLPDLVKYAIRKGFVEL